MMIPNQTTYKPLFIAMNGRLRDGGINLLGRQAPNNPSGDNANSEIFRGFQVHFRTSCATAEHIGGNRAGRVPAAEPKESVA